MPAGDARADLRDALLEGAGEFSRQRALELLEPDARSALEAYAAARKSASRGLDVPVETLGTVPHPLNPRSATLEAPLDAEGDPVTAGSLHSLAAGAESDPSVLMLRVQFPGTSPDWEGDGTFRADRGDAYYEDLAERFLDYYGENSGGRFQPDVTLSDVYTMPEGLDLYGCYDAFFGLGYFLLLLDAVQTADEDIDFSQYDHVLIMHASYGEESDVDGDSPCDIWSAYIPPELTQMILSWMGTDLEGIPTNDGVHVADATFMPQSHDQDGLSGGDILGVLAHEYGHQLGLPDLYDTTYETRGGVGKWSLMASGGWLGNGHTPSHFDAWSKVRLGFVQPETVPAGTWAYTLQPADQDGKILKIPADGANGARKPGEYFLVENRHTSGYDQLLPGTGLLIWHVDETVEDFSGNTFRTHRLVELEEADGDRGLDYTDSGAATDAWANNAAGFSAASNPSSAGYGGLASGVSVTGIGAPGASLSFTVKLATTAPSDSVKPVFQNAFVWPSGIDEGFVAVEVSDNVEVTSVTATVGGLEAPLSYLPVLDGMSMTTWDFVPGSTSRIWIGYVDLPGTETGTVSLEVSDGKNVATRHESYVVDMEAPTLTGFGVTNRLPLLSGSTMVSVAVDDDLGVAGAWFGIWHDTDSNAGNGYEMTQNPETGAWQTAFGLDTASDGVNTPGLYHMKAWAWDDAGNEIVIPLGSVWFSDDAMPAPALTIVREPADDEDLLDGYQMQIIAFCGGCGDWYLGAWRFLADGTAVPLELEFLGSETYVHDHPAATADDVGWHYIEVQAGKGAYDSTSESHRWESTGYFVDFEPPTVTLALDGAPVTEGQVIVAAPNSPHVVRATVTDDLWTALLEDYPDMTPESQEYFLDVAVDYGAFEGWPMTIGEDGVWSWEFLAARTSAEIPLDVTATDVADRAGTAGFALGPGDLGDVTGKLTWKNVALEGFTVGFEKEGSRVEATTDDTGAFAARLSAGTWTVPTDLGREGFALDKEGAVKVVKDGKATLKATVVSTHAGAKLKLTGATAGVDDVQVDIVSGTTDETVATCFLAASDLELSCDNAQVLAAGVLALAEADAYEFVITGATVAKASVKKTLRAGDLVEVALPVSARFGEAQLKLANKATEVPSVVISFSQGDETIATCVFDAAAVATLCDNVEADGDSVTLEAGKYDYVATAEEMKPLAKKGFAITGGKASKIDLKFLPEKAPVTLNLKTPGIGSYAIRFADPATDADAGGCAVYVEEEALECTGAVRAGEYPLVYVPEGKYTVTGEAGEDYKTFEKKGFALKGGKASKLDVQFLPVKASVTLNLKTKDVAGYTLEFRSGGEPVGACTVSVEEELLDCSGEAKAGAYPVVLLSEGKYDVVAAAGADHKDFEKKGFAVKGGKSSKLDVAFTPRLGDVSLNLKTPGIAAWSATFLDAEGVEIGACTVDEAAETVDCTGELRSGDGFPLAKVPDGKYTVVASAGEDFKDFEKKGFAVKGGKAGKLDVKFLPIKALVTLNLKTAAVTQYTVSFTDSDGTTVGTCTVDDAAEEMVCDGLSTPGYPSVFVPEGKYTVTATAGEDYKTFEKKNVALKGGKTTKVDVKFDLAKALVTLTQKKAVVDQYDVTFSNADGDLGTCQVDHAAETIACDGTVTAGEYPTVLVPEGKVTVTAFAGEDYTTFTKALTLKGGKTTKVDVQFKTNFAVLAVAVTNADVEAYAFEVVEGDEVVETCTVDAAGATCANGLVTPLDDGTFKVPDSGSAKWSLVFSTVGDQAGGAADVVVKAQKFAAGKTVKTKVKFVPNALTVVVKGAERTDAEVTVEITDDNGDVHTFTGTTNSKGEVVFSWIPTGDAIITVTAESTSGEAEATVKAGSKNKATVTLA